MGTPVLHSNQARWSFEPSTAEPSEATFDSSSLPFECISDSVGIVQTIQPSTAVSGSRFARVDKSRITSEMVQGTLVIEASPKSIGMFMPYITGTAATPFTMEEATYLDFDFMRYEGGTSHLFRNCYITGASFTVSGGVVQMSLEILGRVGSTGATFNAAALPTSNVYEPYVESDVQITMAGSPDTRYLAGWTLALSSGLEAAARQSLTPNRVRLGTAEVSFSGNVEWTTDLRNEVYAQGTGGISTVLKFARATPAVSTTFTMATLVIPTSPVGADGGELLWNFTGTAMAGVAGATKIISIAHDEAA